MCFRQPPIKHDVKKVEDKNMVLKQEINGETMYCFKEHEYYSLKNTIQEFNIWFEKKEVERLSENSPKGVNQ